MTTTQYVDEALEKLIKRIRIPLTEEDLISLEKVREERKILQEHLKLVNDERKRLIQKYDQVLDVIRNRNEFFISKYSKPAISLTSEDLGLNTIQEDDIEQTKVVEEHIKENPVIPESVPRKLEDVLKGPETQFEVEQ